MDVVGSTPRFSILTFFDAAVAPTDSASNDLGEGGLSPASLPLH